MSILGNIHAVPLRYLIWGTPHLEEEGVVLHAGDVEGVVDGPNRKHQDVVRYLELVIHVGNVPAVTVPRVPN